MERTDLGPYDGMLFVSPKPVSDAFTMSDTRVALDISGRPWLVWKTEFSQKRLGEMDTELFEHFFHSFAQAAGITLHIDLRSGRNTHHILEASFKAVARSLRDAVRVEGADVPSTKGRL